MQQDDPWVTAPAGHPETEPQSLQEALLALDHKSAPVFAVLDGAQFDNLPQELVLGDFISRALYLDRGDNNPEQIITAPHMVWLEERRERITGRAPSKTIPALLALIGDRPAAVFWQCPTGADALYKHLRGINMVLYPRESLPDAAEPQESSGSAAQAVPDTHELVLFRHADANVIAQTLYAMDKPQLARMFGPATAILANPEREWAWSTGPLFAARPEDLQPAYPGPLRLSTAETGRISQAADRASRHRITSYLRAAAPQYTDRLTDKKLHEQTDTAIHQGQQIGLSTEKGLGLFAMLSLLTGGELVHNRDLRAAIASDPRSPDEAIASIFEHISNMSRSEIKAFTS